MCLYTRSVRDEPESTTETGRMIINTVYTLGGEKCIENTLNCVIDGELIVQTWGEEFTVSHLAGSVITLQILHVKSKMVFFFRAVCIITVLMRRRCHANRPPSTYNPSFNTYTSKDLLNISVWENEKLNIWKTKNKKSYWFLWPKQLFLSPQKWTRWGLSFTHLSFSWVFLGTCWSSWS